MQSLKNKTAIITGAGSGIGRAIAILYAAEGAKLVITDLDDKGGNETASTISKNGGEVLFIHADTSKAEDSKMVVDQTLKKFGSLQIAVNNAGIAGPLVPVGEYPVEGWDKVIAINLSGIFYGIRYQIPAMLTSGGGSIVNIASILGKVATKNASGYVAAKHGVIGLTETAAIEYADKKIRVNAVGPGYILTPMLTENMDDATLKAIAGLHPIGRLGTSEEVAELCLWLNSDKASFVTGAYYNVDGGYLAQ